MTKLSTPPNPIKSYVLDTNVLIHDPRALFKFDEHRIFLCSTVLEEVDKLKNESTARGAAAREVNRTLDELFPTPASMAKGAATPKGGRIHFLSKVQPKIETVAHFHETVLDAQKMDHRIILAALHVKDHFPPPTAMVSKDVNVRLMAKALGIDAQDYRNDKVLNAPLHKGAIVLSLPVTDLQALSSTGELEVLDVELAPYSYVLLAANEDPTFQLPVKHLTDGIFRKLHFNRRICLKNGGTTISPRNIEQQYLLDALYDDDVDCVTVFGKAGSGKTLLAVAAALDQARKGRFEKVLATRAIVPMGNDIGFLPGTMEEKMQPWLQPIVDAIELLYKDAKPKQFENKPQSHRKEGKGHQVRQEGTEKPFTNNGKPAPKPYQTLLDSGLLEIQPIAQVRGRSIPNAIFLIDEAQNLTPHEVKTLVTRMSEGAKVILMGDPDQIDAPYLDAQSNGMVHAQDRLQGNEIIAHITLTKSERSRLAELASSLI